MLFEAVSLESNFECGIGYLPSSCLRSPFWCEC